MKIFLARPTRNEEIRIGAAAYPIRKLSYGYTVRGLSRFYRLQKGLFWKKQSIQIKKTDKNGFIND